MDQLSTDDGSNRTKSGGSEDPAEDKQSDDKSLLAESSLNCQDDKERFTSVVNSVLQNDISTNGKFLEEGRPARKRVRKQDVPLTSEVIPYPCPKCDLVFGNSSSAHIHSSFHTLKVNMQFRCLTCCQYLSNYTEYQRHVATVCKKLPKKPQIPLNFYINMPSVSNRLTIFQCLQCAKTFSTRHALQVHYKSNISHAEPAVDPLEINPEREKSKNIQIKQPNKLSQGPGVEHSMRAFVEEVKVEPPDDDIEREDSIPIVDQIATNPLSTASLEIRLPPSQMSSKMTATRIKPEVLEKSKRKARRKEATHLVMYHGFEDPKVATNIFEVPSIEPQKTAVANLAQTNVKLAMKPLAEKIQIQEKSTNKKQVPKIVHPPNRLLNGLSTNCRSPNTSPDKLTGGLSNASPTNILSNVSLTNRRKASRKEAVTSVMYTDFEQSAIFLESQNDESSENDEPSIDDLYCDRCDKIFTAPDKYKNHILFHREKTQYQCDDCGQKFTNDKDYKKHFDVHKCINPFQCPHCQSCCVSKRSLKHHVKLYHDPKAPEKSYHCSKCSNAYSTHHQLLTHLTYHRQKHAFICETCGKKIRHRKEFERHKRGHLGEAPFQCTFCNKRFSERMTLYTHIWRHKRLKTTVSCNVCSATLTAPSLSRHMKMHQPGYNKYPFKCSYCDMSFRLITSKNKHMLSHAAFTGNICRFCHKRLPSKKLLDDHESQHTPKVKLKAICKICGKSVSSQYYLKQHMLQHEPEPKMPFQCGECGKNFTTEKYLSLHSNVHSKVKSFSCKFCDYQCTFHSTGHYHILQTHFGPEGFRENDQLNREKNFFCEVCTEGFVKEASLLQHRMYHQPTKTLKCKKQGCEEMFFTTYDRGYHLVTAHRNQKIAHCKCEFCGKEFNSHSELKQHRRYKHTGESPFSCHLCERQFKAKPDLKYHIATHTGDYKFKCEFCEKKFISKANMHTHLRIHTNHKCRRCGVTWGTAKAWKMHQCKAKMIKREDPNCLNENC